MASLLRQLADRMRDASSGGVSTGASLARNAGWLILDRGVRFLLVFATGILVLRHLGPTDAGRLGNALALAAILAGFCDLGLDPIIRLEVLRDPERRNTLLGTAAGLRLLCVPVLFLAYALLLAREPADVRNIGLLLGVGATLASPVALTLDSWFQSQTQAKYSVWGQTGGLFAGAVFRLIGVALGASLAWFGWAAGLEFVLGGLLMAWLYRRTADTRHWQFSRQTAGRLLAGSWSLALTNLAVLVYTRVDVVLLSLWRGEHDTGIYAAAVRLTELGYIMPMILVNTFFPLLARTFREDKPAFDRTLSRLFAVAGWGGLATGLFLSVGAPLWIRLLYGPAYAETTLVLVISAWNAVFAGLGAVRSQWLVLHGYQRYGLFYVGMGAVLNLCLNAVLIPRQGPVGAAISALITQAVIVVIAPLFFRETRPSVALLLTSLLGSGWRKPADTTPRAPCPK